MNKNTSLQPQLQYQVNLGSQLMNPSTCTNLTLLALLESYLKLILKSLLKLKSQESRITFLAIV